VICYEFHRLPVITTLDPHGLIELKDYTSTRLEDVRDACGRNECEKPTVAAYPVLGAWC